MTTILQNAASWIASINPPHPDYGTSAQSDIQSVHQSVIDFAQVNDLSGNPINQWRGYRYWLGMTTIIPENPVVYASNNNVDWTLQFWMDDVSWYDSIDETMGPVAEDAEIIYDPVGDQIVCYWVRTDETTAPGYTGTVTPGPGVMRRTYSSAGALSAVTCVLPWEGLILYSNSPAVVREDATHWHMFGVVQDTTYLSAKTADYQRITYRFSVDGITWGAVQYLGTVAEFTAAYPGFAPNHITAQFNPVIAGQVDLLINANVYPQPAGSWLTNCRLFHAVVNLSGPTAISYPLAPTAVLGPVSGSWDDVGIYRSGFTLTADSGEMTMRLWYSGIAVDNYPTGQSCRTGYTEGVVYQYDAGGIVAPETTPINASLGTLSLTASAILALDTLSGVEYASLGTLALTAPATLGLGALSGVTTAANQIRAPNGDVRILRNVDGTVRTFNLLT